MKSPLFSLIVSCFMLVACDRKEMAAVPVSIPGEKSGDLESRLPLDVLPGNRERFQQDSGEEADPRMLAHDTPSMEQEARGHYSYQGAAREFKNICGFSMPDWVQPIEGEYSVGKISGKIVSQAYLEYKVDTTRLVGLAELISKSNAQRWPGRGFMNAFFVQPDQGSPKFMDGSYMIESNGIQQKMNFAIFEDGRIKISNARGNLGWDQ